MRKKTIFVDWHGVLSNDVFWASIRNNPHHPLREQLEVYVASLFSSGKATDWMKGNLSSEEIITDFGSYYDCLTTLLSSDCEKMKVDEGCLKMLQDCSFHSFIVLATDNIDCFADTFRSHRNHYPFSFFDDIICSSDVGALKAEDPVAFFGSWLSDHGFSFRDAALIDDRADNCSAFASQGGTAVQWKNSIDKATEMLNKFQGQINGRR